jgi:hypothetical protein
VYVNLYVPSECVFSLWSNTVKVDLAPSLDPDVGLESPVSNIVEFIFVSTPSLNYLKSIASCPQSIMVSACASFVTS